MDLQLTQGEGLEFLPAFLTSLALGLLIGIERERNPAAREGLRTFALVALFGTTAALLSDKLASPWPVVAGLLIVGLMTVAAYPREREAPADPGTTTVVAILFNIAFKLVLVAAIGGPALARRCAPAMLASAAGLGASLALI